MGIKIYLMSDIHGDIKAFKKMLATIKFFEDPESKLYIIGDVFDRGETSLGLLKYMEEYLLSKRIVLIKGNHELFAQMYLQGELNAGLFTAYGGEKTIEELKTLSDEDKLRLVEYLKELPLYTEIDSYKFNFEKPILLTHSGIDADHYVTKENGDIDVCKSIEKAAGDREFKYLISNDIHYIPSKDINRFDKYIICGHVPTFRLNEDGGSNIYKTRNYMCLDSGCGFRDRGGRLSCYCLNNDKVWYV